MAHLSWVRGNCSIYYSDFIKRTRPFLFNSKQVSIRAVQMFDSTDFFFIALDPNRRKAMRHVCMELIFIASKWEKRFSLWASEKSESQTKWDASDCKLIFQVHRSKEESASEQATSKFQERQYICRWTFHIFFELVSSVKATHVSIAPHSTILTHKFECVATMWEWVLFGVNLILPQPNNT